MIITHRFVVLNNPKTGSSFVRTVLKRVHGYNAPSRTLVGRSLRKLDRWRSTDFTELLLPNIKVNEERPKDQHGTYSQIPFRHKSKEIVSVVRNPFDRLLSMYSFRWWEKYPPGDIATLVQRFPHFPDLTFEEFLQLEDLDVAQRMPQNASHPPVGGQTVQFIQMFAKEPHKVLAGLDDAYLDSERLLDDLPSIRFLRTETLNGDLHDFLRRHDYPEEKIAFILEHERVNTSKPRTVGSPWSDELVERVQRRERLLFRTLERLGFSYAEPTRAAS